MTEPVRRRPGRVLVVEDEADLRRLVEFNLAREGYQVEGVGGAWAALQAARARPPDLVILDLMLPDFPGTQVCRELREDPGTREVPILMLTAKGETADRERGLSLGADDYVVKPVSMRELVLRVGAILRRRGEPDGRAAPAVEGSGRPLQLGSIEVDQEGWEARVGGRRLKLSPTEMRLLALLVERAGRVQSREELLARVWQAEEGLTPRTVDTHVHRLRAKLGPEAGRLETVRGIGYRMRREG